MLIAQMSTRVGFIKVRANDFLFQVSVGSRVEIMARGNEKRFIKVLMV